MDFLHNTFGSFRDSVNYERHKTLFSFKAIEYQQHESSRDSIKLKWDFYSRRS